MEFRSSLFRILKKGEEETESNKPANEKGGEEEKKTCDEDVEVRMAEKLLTFFNDTIWTQIKVRSSQKRSGNEKKMVSLHQNDIYT